MWVCAHKRKRTSPTQPPHNTRTTHIFWGEIRSCSLPLPFLLGRKVLLPPSTMREKDVGWKCTCGRERERERSETFFGSAPRLSLTDDSFPPLPFFFLSFFLCGVVNHFFFLSQHRLQGRGWGGVGGRAGGDKPADGSEGAKKLRDGHLPQKKN